MSKRFGRNQKRKMREQITNIQQAHEMDRNLLVCQRQKFNDLESAMQMAYSVLGENWCGFEPKTMRVQDLNQRICLPAFVPLTSLIQGHQLVDSFVEMVMLLEAKTCKALLDDLRSKVHIRAQTPTGELSYCINLDAIASMPEEVIGQRLAHEWTLQLCHDKTFQAAKQMKRRRGFTV